MRFLVLKDGIVENIIVAESIDVAEAATKKTCWLEAEHPTAQIGFAWDAVEENFKPPQPSEDAVWDAETWSWIESIN